MTRSKAGFTLLEVLVALAILAGSLTSIVVIFNRHLSLAAEDRNETTALLLARAKLDDPAFLTADTAEGTFAPDRPDIHWKRKENPSDYPGLRRYTLTVSWQQGKRTLSLVTYGRAAS